MSKKKKNIGESLEAKRKAGSFKDLKNSKKSNWFWLTAILILAFIFLSPVFKGSFINYDDDIYITDNPMIQALDASNTVKLFSSYYFNQYSPLAMLIMGVEFMISNDPVFIKTISVLLHLLVTFLLYKVLSSLFQKPEYIFIPLALFALHPMQVESIAWTTASMKIGTYAAFFLAGLLLYLKYLEKEKLSLLALSFLLFLCSFLCKEQAIAFSVSLLAVDYFKGRDLKSKKVWIEKISFLILSVVFGIVTLKASSGESQNLIVAYSTFDRLLIANYSVFSFIGKILFPVGLSAFYTYPTPDEINGLYYLMLPGFLLVFYAMYLSIKKDNRLLGFGILFFFLNMGLPILSQLLGARDVMMADRYMYISSIGLFIAIVNGLSYLISKFRMSPYYVFGSCIIYILIMGIGTFKRSKVWNDSISLFTDVIEKGNEEGKYSRFLSLAFNNRGIELKKKGDFEAALKDYNMAITINPKDDKSFANRGNINFEKRNLEAAIEDYNKALAINNKNAAAYSSRGTAYGMLGKFDESLKDLNKCLELDPMAKNAYLNRSLVHFNTMKYKEALYDINNHLLINVKDYSSYGQRGLIYLNLGEMNNALQDLNIAINYQPGVAANYLNRSILYKELGDKKSAMQDAIKAQELGMQVPPDFFNGLK